MGGGGGARLCPGPSARSRSLGPPVPRRVRRSRHELHAVQQGPVLRALGRGQEPGEWTRAHRRGAQSGAHRRERGGFAPTPEGWGRSGKRGAARSGRGTPLLCTRGAPAAPPPDIPRPHPGGLPRPELLEGCKQDPGEGGRVGIREERPPRPPSAPASTSLSPPLERLSWGREGGGTGTFLTGCGSPLPSWDSPRTPGRGLTGWGGLRHNGTSKSPVSEGPTHSKES